MVDILGYFPVFPGNIINMMRLERSVATYRLACSEILLSINEKKLERSPEKGRTSYNLVDGLDGVTALAQLYALYSHAF